MTHDERARALLDVVALITRAQAQLDALAVGDTSTMPSELKRGLDAPKEAIRAYARAVSLGASSPDRGGDEDGEPDTGYTGTASPATSWLTAGELADIERRRKREEEEAHRRMQRLLDD